MLEVKRVDKKFEPDYKRVIVKPHIPQSENRVKSILNRVLAIPEDKIEGLLDKVANSFVDRHKNLWGAFADNYASVKRFIPEEVKLSHARKALIGAYFSCEYSIQSAAFFNPSIVPHPNQGGLEEGSMRLILSFRSVGEGHISSIEFRTCVVDSEMNFTFDETSPYAECAKKVNNPEYDKEIFFLKLSQIDKENIDSYKQIYSLLPQKFLLSDLMQHLERDIPDEKVINTIKKLVKSDYQLEFKPGLDLSEKIIFPCSCNDCNGIEDARFIKFTDDNGEVTYYATYTAYNGYDILPQLIETKDFVNFKVNILTGMYSKNKGMALFPRKVNGKYMMISRVDGENLFVMSSDNIYNWDDAELLKVPEDFWEIVQIGNCGSPVETEKGWVLLTHGVGPMREYSIGAILLDIDNPAQIIGNICSPLLSCNEEEREGYVPNVVYSCGALAHNDNLIIPYAMSDTCSGIATIKLSGLFECTQGKENKDYVESS